MKTAQLDTVRSLQRGEIAATETYQQVLKNFVGFADLIDLELIHKDHRTAANTLRQHIRDEGEEPDKSSGAWGTFAKAMEGTARALSQTAALKTLKQGEEQGIKDYENALTKQGLLTKTAILIETELLPKTRSHVSLLNRIIAHQKA